MEIQEDGLPCEGASSGLSAAIGGDFTTAERAQLERLLGHYRQTLKLLAEVELPAPLRTKLDPSDVVQETLLRGYREYRQYRGTTEAEFVAWLREILRNYLIDLRRHYQRKIRDVRRERPLPEFPCIASPSASQLARQAETDKQLQEALQQLPEDYRTVLRLRQDRELTFAEIGGQMGRSADATRMLWGRAVLQLGRLLKRDE